MTESWATGPAPFISAGMTLVLTVTRSMRISGTLGSWPRCVTRGKSLDLSKHVSSSRKMGLILPRRWACLGRRFSLGVALRGRGDNEGSSSLLNLLQCLGQIQASHWFLVFLCDTDKIPRARNSVLLAKRPMVISNRDKLEINGFPI